MKSVSWKSPPVDRHASVADQLEGALAEIEQLHDALFSRHAIAMAEGMLMVSYALDDDGAFAYLARRSQHENTKLREIALQVIAELGSGTRPDLDGSPRTSTAEIR